MAKWYVVAISDAEIADKRWPSTAPHAVGQIRSVASQDDGDADSLERGITPPEIMALNGVEAIEIDHEPDFSVERWDAASGSFTVIADDPALAALEDRRAALDAEIARLRG
jgi:hypothetical protein